MGYRHRARECAMQMLFQIEMSGDSEAHVRHRFWQSNPGQREPVREYADRLVTGAVQHLDKIDATLTEAAHHWRLDRMSAVDRAVLRMSIYEMLYEPETPPNVVIDEAIEVAKKYSSPESGGFVNGILDGIKREITTAAT